MMHQFDPNEEYATDIEEVLHMVLRAGIIVGLGLTATIAVILAIV